MGNACGPKKGIAEDIMLELENEITWWTRAEITHAWKRFDKLYDAYAAKVLAETGEAFTDLYDVEGYGKVDGVKLTVDFIIDNFEELKVNPFRRRICQVFSSDDDQQTMSFIDFLDMVSGLSPKNPLNTRIIYAFLIFGETAEEFPHLYFDGDGHLGPSDLKEMLDYYTGKDEKLDDVHKERLVQEILSELNKSTNSRAGLHLQDFRVAINRSPDFSKTFSFRI